MVVNKPAGETVTIAQITEDPNGPLYSIVALVGENQPDGRLTDVMSKIQRSVDK